MLYQTSLDSKYIDYYERALYNHILSTQNPTTGGLVYFTQMRPGHYRVYSQPHQGMWCCVGSGMENHSKYGEMIYAHTADELYVNLFIPSVLNWEQKQTQIVQQTSFPDEAKTTIVVNPIKKKRFAIHFHRTIIYKPILHAHVKFRTVAGEWMHKLGKGNAYFFDGHLSITKRFFK